MSEEESKIFIEKLISEGYDIESNGVGSRIFIKNNEYDAIVMYHRPRLNVYDFYPYQ
jgi:hypothetical protein